MNIIEALKSGKPLRRNKGIPYPEYTTQYSYIDPEELLLHQVLTREDILANDWEIQPEPEKTVLVTERQVFEILEERFRIALHGASRKGRLCSSSKYSILTNLGFEEGDK